MRTPALLALLLVACQGQELPTAPPAPAAARVSPELSPKLSLAPYITAIWPSIGSPRGGERIVIEGRQFDVPARVFFRVDGVDVESVVLSVSPTRIEAFTPPIANGDRQRVFADVRVVVRAGSTYEMYTIAENAFAFQPELLTPSILTVTPNRARLNAITRFTAFGEGFQQPVTAFLVQGERTIEIRIIRADYDRVEFETMPGLRAGPADLIVRNVITSREAVLPNAIMFSGKPEAGARM